MKTAMTSLAISIPARVRRRRRPGFVHQQTRVDDASQLARHTGPRRRRRTAPRIAARSRPAASRRPMNSASSHRSSRRQHATLGDDERFAPHPVDVVHGSSNVAPAGAVPRRMGAAAEPQPLAVVPVLDVVPRLAGPAAPRWRSRTARSRPHRAAPAPSRYISAASSSGASDQPARAMSSRSGAFGYTSSRYSDACSGRLRDRARRPTSSHWSTRLLRAATSSESRLTLSKPACAREPPARRLAVSARVQPAEPPAAPRHETTARRS